MSAPDTISLSGGGVTVRIEGLRRTLRAMEAAGVAAESMRDLMHSIGLIVVGAARPSTPVLTGALAGTLRAGKGKTKAVIRAGRASVPYAGVIHYGWPARGIQARPFLTSAVQSTRSQTFSALEEGIDQLLKKQDLK